MTDDTLDRAIRAFYEEAELSERALDALEPKPETRWRPLYTALLVLAAAATLFVATRAGPPTATAPAPAVAPAAEELTWTITVAELGEAVDPLGSVLEPDALAALPDDFELPAGAVVTARPTLVADYGQQAELFLGSEPTDRIELKLVARPEPAGATAISARIALPGQAEAAELEVGPVHLPVSLGVVTQVGDTWFPAVVDVWSGGPESRKPVATSGPNVRGTGPHRL